MAVYFDNAIFWAQLRLRGGWKNLFLVVACYAGAAVFFITLFYQLADHPRDKNYVLEAASVMTLMVQILMLPILGGAAVSGALRRDVANHLIESHRLMPLSPVQAIVGYIAGAGLQMLSLCMVNFVVGAVLLGLRGAPVQPWLVCNGLLLGFSISIWTAMTMAAFVSRAIFGLVIGLFISIAFSGGSIFAVVPGLLAFCSPMHGHTIFDSAAGIAISTGTIVALAAQFLVAVLCIRGAARKYADADAISLTLGPALAALGIWAGLSWFGIYDFHELRPIVLLGYRELDLHVLAVGAIASCFLLAMLPLAAAASGDILRQQRSIDGVKKSWRPALIWLCLPVCLLFVLAPMTSSVDSSTLYPVNQYITPAPPVYPTTRHGGTASAYQPGYQHHSTSIGAVPVPLLGTHAHPEMILAVSAIFLLQTYLLMRLLYPLVSRPNALILFITAILWFAPLFADMVYYGVKDQDPRLDNSALCSPLGTIAQALDKPAAGTWSGILIQGAFCLLLAIVFFFQGQFRRRPSRQGSIGFPAVL
jgi:hypothetical protein